MSKNIRFEFVVVICTIMLIIHNESMIEKDNTDTHNDNDDNINENNNAINAANNAKYGSYLIVMSL